jgi:NaMN:DMB phosphoribosyltransferase
MLLVFHRSVFELTRIRPNPNPDVKTLADRAFMSETTAARCLEAWRACVAALIEVGRLPNLAKAAAKKTATKKPPKPLDAQPAAAGTTQSVEQNGTVVDTGGAAVS